MNLHISNKNTLSTKLETFLLDLKVGATAVVRFLLRVAVMESQFE